LNNKIPRIDESRGEIERREVIGKGEKGEIWLKRERMKAGKAG